MKTKKNLLVAASIVTALTFTGCTQDQENLAIAGIAVAAIASNADGSHTGNYYHHGQDYGTHRNYSYRDGVRAGCSSVRGNWTKDRNRFNNNTEYRAGWKHGKRQCSTSRYAD